MDRTQFTFYASFYKAVSRIKDGEARAQVYDAICEYALYGNEPDMNNLSDMAAIAYELIKPNLDASRKKAENGKIGGKKKQNESKNEANQKQDESRSKKEKENKNKNKKEKEIEIEIEKEKESYNMPTSDELVERFQSQELADAVIDWLSYKKERRERYKPTGLKSLLLQIEKQTGAHGAHAVADTIRMSMSNGWRGIIWDRIQSPPEQQKSSNPFWEMLREEEAREQNGYNADNGYY